MLDFEWFEVDGEEREQYESNFRNSGMTQLALTKWAQHELDKLDKSITLAKLKEIPDKGEYLLMVQGQRQVLLNLIDLLNSEEMNNAKSV